MDTWFETGYLSDLISLGFVFNFKVCNCNTTQGLSLVNQDWSHIFMTKGEITFLNNIIRKKVYPYPNTTPTSNILHEYTCSTFNNLTSIKNLMKINNNWYSLHIFNNFIFLMVFVGFIVCICYILFASLTSEISFISVRKTENSMHIKYNSINMLLYNINRHCSLCLLKYTSFLHMLPTLFCGVVLSTLDFHVKLSNFELG